ncbi:hypothetical protein ACFFS2_25580 [Streptomyces aurantiacus]|uniref:hypothetical protein n=1 Tax=Streptomyces aurantiacus TaxID=47760 RepID=UPI0012FF43CD|nr:hypothetical protein [Streptomyces aurantiacus]
MTAATHAATAPSAVDWSAAEAPDDAEASSPVFSASDAGELLADELLADDFSSEAESLSSEHPASPTTAATATPAIEPTLLAL